MHSKGEDVCLGISLQPDGVDLICSNMSVIFRHIPLFSNVSLVYSRQRAQQCRCVCGMVMIFHTGVQVSAPNAVQRVQCMHVNTRHSRHMCLHASIITSAGIGHHSWAYEYVLVYVQALERVRQARARAQPAFHMSKPTESRWFSHEVYVTSKWFPEQMF